MTSDSDHHPGRFSVIVGPMVLVYSLMAMCPVASFTLDHPCLSARLSSEKSVCLDSKGHLASFSLSIIDLSLAEALSGHTGTIHSVHAVEAKTAQEASAKYAAAGSTVSLAATGGEDGKLILWDLLSAEQIASHDCGSEVWCTRLSRDAKKVLAVTDEGNILAFQSLRDVGSSSARPVVLSGGGQVILSADWSPDAGMISAGGWDAYVRIYSVGNEKHPQGSAPMEARASMGGHEGWIHSVRFHGANTLVTASADKTVRLWNAANGSSIRVSRTHSAPALCAVVISPGSGGSENATSAFASGPSSSLHASLLASGSQDFTIHLVDLATEKSKPTVALVGHTGPVTSICPLRGGKFLLSSSADKSIRIWDLRMMRLLVAFDCAKPCNSVSAVHFHIKL